MTVPRFGVACSARGASDFALPVDRTALDQLPSAV